MDIHSNMFSRRIDDRRSAKNSLRFRPVRHATDDSNEPSVYRTVELDARSSEYTANAPNAISGATSTMSNRPTTPHVQPVSMISPRRPPRT